MGVELFFFALVGLRFFCRSECIHIIHFITYVLIFVCVGQSAFYWYTVKHMIFRPGKGCQQNVPATCKGQCWCWKLCRYCNMLLSRVICNNVCSKRYKLTVSCDAFHFKRLFSVTNGDEPLDTTPVNADKKDEKKRGGFAQAFQRYTSPPEIKTQTPEREETFASLLRNSKFIDVIILYNTKLCNSNGHRTA